MQEDNLISYLENTAVTPVIIENRLIHPITGLRLPTRLAYVLLRKYAKDFFTAGNEPRMVSLAGLRGTGKTTLLWQTAAYIHASKCKNIYFFNVNTLKSLGVSLFEALESFQKNILKKRFNELSEPIVLLFDEVHDDEQWSQTLKILYDEARSAFILCTGSSALLLNQTADLARRMRIEKIYPFKFIEFIGAKTYLEDKGNMLFPVKGLSSSMKEILFYSETAEQVYASLQMHKDSVNAFFTKLKAIRKINYDEVVKSYISYQNIPNFLFYSSKTAINDSILELFKRVILEDIPKLNPAYTDHIKIERLILRLAGSDEINPEKLAGLVGIKMNEVHDLIDILAKAELINVLLPYGGIDTRLNRNRKAFFMSPSLRRALLSTVYGQNIPDSLRGKLLEDITVMYLKRILTDGIITFSAVPDSTNPDFVIETRETPILLEVGTNKNTSEQITGSKINHRYGLIVNASIDAPYIKGNVIYLPFSWFLLM